ncbi:MAG: hypothetical protein RAP70_06110 [Candidatus Celaenobacter antarcticus]|nr:hypothetical protein [Candidatus Celaenobacter antarcticus]
MEGIIKQDVNQRYECEILGFGEIFEIKSVERIRKRLMKKYKDGVLYLSSNKDHSGKGFTREEVESAVRNDGLQLLESGYADAPPWKSDPLETGQKSSKMKIPILSKLAPLLFVMWIPVFEQFYRKRRKAHVVWVFGVVDEK